MNAAGLSVSRETPTPRAADPVVDPRRKGIAMGFGSGLGRALRRAPAALVLAPIRAYRLLLSPLLGPRCRYFPSCSAYAEEAVSTLGARRGTIVAVWRVLRCNPLSAGGLDPLENRRLFRGADRSSSRAEQDPATHAGHPADSPSQTHHTHPSR